MAEPQETPQEEEQDNEAPKSLPETDGVSKQDTLDLVATTLPLAKPQEISENEPGDPPEPPSAEYRDPPHSDAADGMKG